MKSTRVCFTLGIVTALSLSLVRTAAAQYGTVPATTSVYAYQPVVTPVSPSLISGWYPGKLLDTWAANRATYRASVLPSATSAYRPVTSALPVTAYQPVVSSDPCTGCSVTSYRPIAGVTYHTSYMPLRLWRPLLPRPLVATTAYMPVVSTSSISCDPCSATAVSGYAATTSDCCGTTVSNGAYGDVVTPIPTLGPNETILDSSEPRGAGRPPANTEGAEGDNSSGTNGTGNSTENGTGGTNPTGFEAPPLLIIPDQASPDESEDRTARLNGSDVVPAVYRDRVQPFFAGDRNSRPATAKKPSRADMDAGWTAAPRD